MIKQKKIAFFVGSFPVISETFVIDQMTALVENGHQIDIYATRRGRTDKIQEGVNKHNLLKRTYFKPHSSNNILKRVFDAICLIISLRPELRILRRILNFIKHGRQALNLSLFYETVPFWRQEVYDVILCHFGPNGNRAVAMRELELISGPIVTIFHGFDVSHYLELFGKDTYNNLLEKGDLFLTVSNFWRKKLLELGFDNNKLILHRVGIETKKFIFRPPVPLSDKPLITILSVGRFVEKKGFEYGIRSIELLRRKRYPVKYIILGDGPMRNKLNKLIKEKGLQSHVLMPGACENDAVRANLKRADIVLVPSITASNGDMEGIPVILMEAMASGVPVVASNHSGIPEIVKNDFNGFLVEEGDVDGIAASIESIINGPGYNLMIALRARKTIEKYFNARKQIKKLESILEIASGKHLLNKSFRRKAPAVTGKPA